MDLLANGWELDPLSLSGAEYHGLSLGLPEWAVRLSWKTFQKVFHCDRSGAVVGWNVRAEQGEGPVRPMLRDGVPWTFGYFNVRGPRLDGSLGTTKGVVLDYDSPHNGSLSPLRLVRDPLVALEPFDTRYLLGRTYLELGGSSLATPSFFLLERGDAPRFIPPAIDAESPR